MWESFAAYEKAWSCFEDIWEGPHKGKDWDWWWPHSKHSKCWSNDPVLTPQKLQSVYNHLRHAQDPGKSRDPLEYLPLELAEMICLNLSMRDRTYVMEMRDQ